MSGDLAGPVPDAATAYGCAAPIDMGHPDWVLKPLTVHPAMLPPITDASTARRLPELAVLSAPAHADGHDAEAKSVLLVLDARGVSVPDHVRERITSCTDLEQLDRWIQRATVVDHAEQLLD